MGGSLGKADRPRRERLPKTAFCGEGEAAGIALAGAVRSPPVVVTVPHDELREPFLQIFSRIDRERLVTTVEALSLTNKTPGAQGRDLYLRKQREVLERQVNLVEIDLLRTGEHTTAVPRDRALERAGPFDYHVSVHRFDQFEDYFVYPIHLEDRLPAVEIPLLPGDPDVRLELQSVFDGTYDTGPYRRRVSYRTDPLVPSLDPERTAWAARLVQGD